MENHELKDSVKNTIKDLLSYCQQNDWAGYDPYDGLNSRIFKAIPFFQNKFFRLAFIQSMKRSPINFRSLFLVPKEQNPKGLALFVSALIKLSNIGFLENTDTINALLNRLIQLRSPDLKFYCWGYNFDWQNRGFFLPRFSPNIICTTFVANAILDYYDKCREQEYLDMAVSAGHFLIYGLNLTEDSAGLCFSYTALDHGQVHNANLLGAAFLARLYNITGEKEFGDYASKAVIFTVSKQNSDGSWPYGEAQTQRWIDNFHTGYNLVALKKFSEYSNNKDFNQNIEKGYQFYKDHFFTENGIAKYFHNRVYPIDIHSIAQSMVTLSEFKEIDRNALNLGEKIFKWSLDYMKSNNGNFYFQKNPYFCNKIPYMRWSQAWMLCALSIFAESIC